MDYICEHCLANLGKAIEGELQPVCIDHIGGAVSLMESDNADS